MKPKAIMIASFLAIFVTVATIPDNTWAGSTQRHRWEGVAIGIGAAIIGSALINSLHGSPAVVGPAPTQAAVHYYHERPRAPKGYWTIEKEWVEPTCKKEWNPGHYNRRGQWVPGGWIQLEVEPGHWIERKVWVPYR
jgi:hypothetical protein